MPSNRSRRGPQPSGTSSILATVAIAVQLVLAVAVGAIVTRNLAADTASTAPWALAYLTWCVTILRQIANRSNTN